jgi:hypothetical protein
MLCFDVKSEYIFILSVTRILNIRFNGFVFILWQCHYLAINVITSMSATYGAHIDILGLFISLNEKIIY